MAEVALNNVNKVYPNGFHAVKDASFTVADKEFVVLVGPSGCGKTTLLRMIAGLETISSGELSIGGRLVNDRPPKERDIAMVFQNYALYPHMNVFDNMAMSLRIRKTPKDEVRERVEDAARLLGVDHLLDRRPSQLSGGQRQRVALGRAIVRRPKVFLFDEPLSNLDAKMRVEMRTEISRLHKRLEATMIYVTHDQTEAMTMGDRIVVIEQGVLQQVAPPLELYDRPANRFVAGFVGSPAMNFFDGAVADRALLLDGVRAELLGESGSFGRGLADGRFVLGLRPEDLHLDAEFASEGPRAAFPVKVDVLEPLGSETLLYWRHGDATKVARISPSAKVGVGDEVRLVADLRKAHVFDPSSGERISVD